MKCPFLESIVVNYCKAYPKRVMVPESASDEPCYCFGGKHLECDVLKTMAHQDQPETLSSEKIHNEKEEINMATNKIKAKSDEKQCIWMKAAVVSYRICVMDYNCANCDFNQMLMDSAAPGAQAGEVAGFTALLSRLRRLPGDQRPCRYMLQGAVSHKICARNYECGTCPYDQMMQDMLDYHLVRERPRVKVSDLKKKTKVEGYSVPIDLHYHKGHTWMRNEGEGLWKVGIDDFAQQLVGDVKEVTLPQESQKIDSGEPGFKVKTSFGIARLKAPVSGEVVQVNTKLAKEPSLANSDPYGSGWAFTIKPSELDAELAQLLKEEEARNWMGEEAKKLEEIRKFESAPTPSLPDGGASLGEEEEKTRRQRWNTLIETFSLVGEK